MSRLAAVLLAALTLTGGLSAAPPPLASYPEGTHRLLVAALRAHLDELSEIEKQFNGSISTSIGPFAEIGKVDFILSHSNRFPRRYLHEHDHNFVFTAVKGQTATELEANLPAIVHYVRLAVASRWYNYRARRQLPLVGERKGLAEVNAIAKRVFDFRARQLERIERGTLPPSQALSTANLGDLGRPELLAELETAFEAGQHQFTTQRNSVVFVLIAIEIGISFLIAVLYLRRARPLVVVHSRA